MSHQFSFYHGIARMTLRTGLRVGLLAHLCIVGAVACGSDGATDVSTGHAYVRLINSTYLDSSATTPVGRYSAVSIDVLFDSSLTAPSFVGTPANSVNDLDGGAGSTPGNLDAGYRALPVGVRSFVARLHGLSPEGPSFFVSTAATQYLPRQYLSRDTYYTLIIAGKARPQDSAENALAVLNDSTDFTGSTSFFPHLIDDPFAPPAANDALQARFRVINAAPFFAAAGTGGTLSIFMTKGLTPPSQAVVSTLTALATAVYRNGSAYINSTAGDFVITIGAGTSIRYQYPITLRKGEVRTLVFQNDLSQVPAGYNPASSQSNFKITNIQDNQY